MDKLDTPDLCARLDTMKALCDRLEAAQHEPQKYHQLVELIRIEADALRNTVCETNGERDRKAGDGERRSEAQRVAARKGANKHDAKRVRNV
jgi:hypothetical protein